MILSGPMFEIDGELMTNLHREQGAHYSIWQIKHGKEMQALRLFFPNGECDEMNLVIFSTSGVHGSYLTIEQIENCLKKYGDHKFENGDEPEDFCYPYLTGTIYQPRLVCLRYFGEMKVSLEDIPYLKKLRESSQKAFLKIGMADLKKSGDIYNVR